MRSDISIIIGLQQRGMSRRHLLESYKHTLIGCVRLSRTHWYAIL